MMQLPARIALLLALAAAAPCATSAPESAPASPPSAARVEVSGAGIDALALGAAELAKLPRHSVRGSDHGVEAVFEGVSLADVLVLAGTPLGKALRGEALGLVLVVGAADGYRAVFALAELDPAFTDRVVLLADRRDGKPLSGAEGPLRIVVPGEKRQARWVRQVTSLQLRAAK